MMSGSFGVSMTEAANGIAGHEGAGVVVAVGDDMKVPVEGR